MSMNIAKGIYIDANYRLHYPEGKFWSKFLVFPFLRPPFLGLLLLINHSYNCSTYLYLGASMMDNFPEELNEVVYTDHWKLFPPQHPLIVDFFGLLFFFLWCISFFGNGIVIIIFLITKNLRTPVSLNYLYHF